MGIPHILLNSCNCFKIEPMGKSNLLVLVVDQEQIKKAQSVVDETIVAIGRIKNSSIRFTYRVTKSGKLYGHLENSRSLVLIEADTDGRAGHCENRGSKRA